MPDLILIGDRVLIDPADPETETPSGLLLPASVKEKERVQGGRVVNVGPGYITPNPEYSEGEPWAPTRPPVRYLPLQAQVGDFAFFLRKDTIELEFEGTRYLIVPHHAIVALVREQPDERELYEGLEDL